MLLQNGTKIQKRKCSSKNFYSNSFYFLITSLKSLILTRFHLKRDVLDLIIFFFDQVFINIIYLEIEKNLILFDAIKHFLRKLKIDAKNLFSWNCCCFGNEINESGNGVNYYSRTFKNLEILRFAVIMCNFEKFDYKLNIKLNHLNEEI